jgi:hypothetical protein
VLPALNHPPIAPEKSTMDTNLKTPDQTFKRLGTTCRHCGLEILPRQLREKVAGRRSLFCSDACRKDEFRRNQILQGYHPTAPKKQTPQIAKVRRNGGNNPVISMRQKAGFADPRAAPELWRGVQVTERPWLNRGQEVVSPSGVSCFVVGRLRRARHA